MNVEAIYLEQEIKVLQRILNCVMIIQKEMDDYVEECQQNDQRGNLL